MQRALWLVWYLAAALAPACFFDPSLAPRDVPGDASPDGGGDGGGDDGGPDGGDDSGMTPMGFTALAAGTEHVCGVLHDTRLRCWGDNTYQQLGAPLPVRTGTPQTAFVGTDLELGWTAIAAGAGFTCGINTAMGARVYCWGRNTFGAADPANPGSSVQPNARVLFSGGFEPASIHAGHSTACALSAPGELRCWGLLDMASPGNAGVTVIAPGTTVRSIALADTHACLLDDEGVAKCWGVNDHLALGREGSAQPPSGIAPIDSTTRFAALSASHNVTCGITTAGALACWGDGGSGHLGAPQQAHSTFTIVDSAAGRVWQRVAAGNAHVCAVATGASAGTYCYGDTESGALGNGRFARRFSLDAPLEGLGPTAQIVANRDFVCALDTAGAVTCWGANTVGQLGNKEIARKLDHVRVALPAGVIRKLSSGDHHTCAIVDTDADATDTTFCWGDNRRRQSAPNSTADAVSIPAAVPDNVLANETLIQISSGAWHTCGLDTDGDIRCWGENETQQAPVMAVRQSGQAWSGVFAGSLATCGIAGGTLYCWGQQPMNGGTFTHGAAKQYAITSRTWREVAIGSNYMIGVLADDTSRYFYALGPGCQINDSNGDHMFFEEVMTGLQPLGAHPHAYAADNNGAHTCVHYRRNEQNGITCFGNNAAGQVYPGQPSCMEKQNPISNIALPAEMDPSPNAIALGNNHSCAINAAGALLCWGANDNYPLGGLPSGQLPMQLGPTETYAEVVTGYEHTCAITSDRMNVHCWGLNRLGQAGDGTQWRASPVAAGEP